MSERFCARCNASVEDAGGYCLLGHRLSEAPPTGSLTDLRAEVDAAFEQARAQVSVMLQGAPPPPPGPAAGPIQAPAAYATIELDHPTNPADPINEFAPAPRMDWGPERHGRLKRRG